MPGGPPNIDDSFKSLEQLGFGAGAEDFKKDQQAQKKENLKDAYDAWASNSGQGTQAKEKSDIQKTHDAWDAATATTSEAARARETQDKGPERPGELTRAEHLDRQAEQAADFFRNIVKRTNESSQKAKDGGLKAYVSSSNYLNERIDGLAQLLKMPFNKEGRAQMKTGTAEGAKKTAGLFVEPMSAEGRQRIAQDSETLRAARATKQYFTEGKGRGAYEKVAGGAKNLQERWSAGRDGRRESYQGFRQNVADAKDRSTIRLDDFWSGVIERKLVKKDRKAMAKYDKVTGKKEKVEGKRDAEIRKAVDVKLAKKEVKLEAKKEKMRKVLEPLNRERRRLNREIKAAKPGSRKERRLKTKLDKVKNKISTRSEKWGDRISPIEDKIADIEARRQGIENKYESRLKPHKDKLNEIKAARKELKIKRTEKSDRRGRAAILERQAKIDALSEKLKDRLGKRVEIPTEQLEMQRDRIVSKYDQQILPLKSDLDLATERLAAAEGAKRRKLEQRNVDIINEKIAKLENKKTAEIKRVIAPKQERFAQRQIDLQARFDKRKIPHENKIANLTKIRVELGLEEGYDETQADSEAV